MDLQQIDQGDMHVFFFAYNYRVIEIEKFQRNFLCVGKCEKLEFIIVEVNQGFQMVQKSILIHSLLQNVFSQLQVSNRLFKLKIGLLMISLFMSTLLYFLSALSFMVLRNMHCLQVNVMLKELPEEEFGPQIDIKEYSFFENPSVPRQVNELHQITESLFLTCNLLETYSLSLLVTGERFMARC